MSLKSNSGVCRTLRQLRWVLYPRRCPFCDRVLGTVSPCPDCCAELDALRRKPTMRLSAGLHYLGRLEGAAAPYRAAPWAADELGAEMARLLFGSEAKMGTFGPEVQPVPGLALSYDCIVPVPASSRARGYNVPERMARPIARTVGVPLEPKALVRVHAARRQEGLSLDERLANVAGAFAVPDPERVEGKRVLLVDDVITTGATAAACAQALLAAGAQSIFAVALATVEFDARPQPSAQIHENSEEEN